MNLKDLVETLLYGELSSLVIADTGTESMSLQNKKKILFLLEGTLKELYTKFRLKDDSVIIKSIEWKSTYLLDSKFSMRNKDSTEPTYIDDSVYHPFTDNILRIFNVLDEVGRKLPLNDNNDNQSVFTPAYNIVQLTHVDYEQSFEISYQANHPKIQLLEDDIEFWNQPIIIPTPLEEALLAKMASRFFIGMSGQNVTNKSTELLNRYEEICNNAKRLNTVDEYDISTTHKLVSRGFP